PSGCVLAVSDGRQTDGIWRASPMPGCNGASFQGKARLRRPDVFRRSEFTDADWMDYLKSLDLPHLNDWMRDQAERGQEFYRRRLRQIGFRGERVLDAGCGAGNWTIALACCCTEVVAIDIDPVRVGVTAGMQKYFDAKISTQIGSIDALPFPDES